MPGRAGRCIICAGWVHGRAPHHERIARLPWARREPLSLRTCAQRRFFAVAWLRWLAGNGVQRLEEVTQGHCDKWLHQRRGDEAAAGSMSNEVTAIKDLARYTELFTAGCNPADFMPWAGKTTTQVAEADWADENKTPPVPDSVMRPALRASLYLVDTNGPSLLAWPKNSPLTGRAGQNAEHAATRTADT
jgi:hypothetical protein